MQKLNISSEIKAEKDNGSRKPLYQITLRNCYGPLKSNMPYNVWEEGRDYLVVSKNIYVPKNLTNFYEPESEKTYWTYEDFIE